MRHIVPPSLSPAERAQIKAVRALAFIVCLNAAFAVSMFILSRVGMPWNWSAIGVFAGGQILYGALDVGEKYFSAKNQPTIAEIFDLGRQEGMARLHMVGDVTNPALEQVVSSEVQTVVKDEEQTPPT